MSRLWQSAIRNTAWIALGITACLSPALRAAETRDEAPPTPASQAPAAAASSDGDEPVPVVDTFDLRFRFEPQQLLRYEVEHQSEFTTLYNDLTEVATNRSQMRRSYKVLGVQPNGDADLQLSIDWARMMAEFGNGQQRTKSIEFQSDDPAKHPPAFQQVLDAVGKPQATIRFSAAGRALEVKTDKPVTPGGGAEAPTAPGSIPGASHESYLIPLPEVRVAVGNTWKERFEVTARDSEKLPVRVTLQRSYKLSEVKEGLATIEFRTVILTPVQDPTVSAQLIQRETVGKLVFDLERGRIVSRHVTVEGNVLNPFGPKSSMRATSVWKERLIAEPQVARKEAEVSGAPKQ
ncbi:MAG: hypothetical protein ACKV0T_23370 [Planctomycetales bacterium]